MIKYFDILTNYQFVYLLIYSFTIVILHFQNIKVIIKEQNVLIFSLLYGETIIEFDYNRNIINQKFKKIIADDVIIQFENNNDDPLLSIIDKCLHNNIDYLANNMTNLITKKIFENISNKINKSN